MNNLAIISSLILYLLALLCFFIPFQCGKKAIGKNAGIILGIIITLTIIIDFSVLTPFILLPIIIFQLIFIIYWTFVKFKQEKAGKITVMLLTSIFVLMLMQPWISDWIFSKNDVREILLENNITLKDDFRILKNETITFDGYYEDFSIKISDADFNRISQQIKTSKQYKGFFDNTVEIPELMYKNHDTLIDYEAENHFGRQYRPNKKMKNGVFNIAFWLDKQDKTLRYSGTDQ